MPKTRKRTILFSVQQRHDVTNFPEPIRDYQPRIVSLATNVPKERQDDGR
jgi:hypothetical protein